MQICKCDRCGKIMTMSERFCGHINGHIADLCEVCHTEFKKDIDAVDRLYAKNRQAIAQKFGMVNFYEIMKGDR